LPLIVSMKPLKESALEKHRILIVDDSKVMRHAFNKILGHEYDVITADNGEEAWDLILSDTAIKVIFTDLSMPILDGHGLLKRIRESDQVQINKIPVVIITGKEDVESTKEEVLGQGANDFITKPFDTAILKARAMANIRLTQATEELERISKKLESEAAVDSLTGLGSLRYFEMSSTEALAQVKRHGGQFILLYLSIDNISDIAEKYSTKIRDAIVKEVGKRLASTVRIEDKASRIAGNKFAFLLLSSDLESAQDMAGRIQKQVASIKFNIGMNSFRAASSIGLYQPKINAQSSLAQIQDRVDVCLKQAILAGSYHIQVQSDLVDVVLAKTDVTNESMNLSINEAFRLLEAGQFDKLISAKQSIVSKLEPMLTVLFPESESIKNLLKNNE